MRQIVRLSLEGDWPTLELALPPLVTRAATVPYQERLQALIEADRIYDMLVQATYDMDRTIPNEKLVIAERIWFDGREEGSNEVEHYLDAPISAETPR